MPEFTENSPKAITNMPLVKANSLTRLSERNHGSGIFEDKDIPPPPPAKEGLDKNGTNGKNGEKVHDHIHELRKYVKPEEVWLCSALELAVDHQPYDVDKMRNTVQGLAADKAYQSKRVMGVSQEMDVLAFPEENTGAKLNSMLGAFSPRAVPVGNLTASHQVSGWQGWTGMIATPRSPQGSPGVTPRDQLMTPRSHRS
jgi:hypothetical protein